ncbi:hypothetical protein ACHQM5_001870 [Ranunculus cassubicifolius]
MGSEIETRIPCFDLTKDPRNLIQGSDEWKDLCNRVRDAAEEYGCLEVLYSNIPASLTEDMFNASKELFDLPQETKVKNTSSKPYYGYLGKIDAVPLFESMGFEDPLSLQSAQTFAQAMWSDGNPAFCETANAVSNKMYGLGLIILKMIMESYQVEEYYDSYVRSSSTVLRLIKYDAPKGNDSEIGLAAHVDKNAFAVLSQNSVHGLEVLLKGGNWIPILPQIGSFTFVIGDSLKAWSNGRLHAARHRVMMSGDSVRYSFGFFLTPNDEAVIEAPKELIDEAHPRLFRPFNYVDFLSIYDTTLEAYATV